MKFSELPIEEQQRLNENRLELYKGNVNTAYEVLLYNTDGTRKFYARRVCQSWNDDNGNYMPFGGGTVWQISYRSVAIKEIKDVFGGYYYELGNGKIFTKSLNGTIIPSKVATKKEVIELIKSIGIFNL